MKFDALCWDEVKTNVQIEVPKGRLRLQVSAPVAVYVEAHGVEALAGYGAAHTLDFSEAVKVRIEAAKGVRAFRYAALPSSITVTTEEVFTNADRMPYESGMMAEVTRARRMLELERRQMMAEMRAESAKTKASIRKARMEAGIQDGEDGETVPAAAKKAAQAPVAENEGAQE